MKYETQIESLEKIEKLYSEMSRVTSQLDFEKNNHEHIINQRQEFLNEITHLQDQRKTLPLGADEEEIEKAEQRIKELLLSILADSQVILEESKVLRDSIKEELSKLSTINKAARSYAAHSKKII